MTKQLMLTIYK